MTITEIDDEEVTCETMQRQQAYSYDEHAQKEDDDVDDEAPKKRKRRRMIYQKGDAKAGGQP